jgi:hypothetical protein
MHLSLIRMKRGRTRKMRGRQVRGQGYQDPKNIVNVIFSGDGGFRSKCA